MDKNLIVKVTVEKEDDVKTKVVPDSSVKVKASEMKYVKQNLQDADATPEDVLVGRTFYSKNSEDKQEGTMNPGDYAPIQTISKNGEIIEPDENRNVDIEVTKEDLGLGNVDNTKDIDKPVSTAQKEALDKKVDKEFRTNSETDYKVLSDNNYTDEEKETLSELAKMKENDEFGKVDDIKINGESIVKDKIANIELVDGFEDESVNKFSSAKNTSLLNKKINELEKNKVSVEEGKGLSSNDFTNEFKTKLEGLQNYDDTELKKSVSNLEDTKVSKEEGKGLSENDFTTFLKTKLEGIEEFAQANKLESISVNDAKVSVTNKNINIVAGENVTITNQDNNITINAKGGSGSANYPELKDLPTLDTTNTSALDVGSETINGTMKLHKVSKTGSFNDLLNVPTTIAHTDRNNNFGASQTFNGDITVNGNIIQQGENYITQAEEVKTKNDYITLREGAVGGLIGYAGFEVIKYDGTNNGRLVIDGTGTARVGDVGDEQPLATREENPIENGFAIWDKDNFRFKTTTDVLSKTKFDEEAVKLTGDQEIGGIKDLKSYLKVSSDTAYTEYKNNLLSYYQDSTKKFEIDYNLGTFLKGSYSSTLPDKTGTIALLSDIPTDYAKTTDLNNYLPLSAGTSNGLKNLLKINNSFGIVAGYKGVSLCYSPEGENAIGHIVYFEHKTGDWDRVTPNGNNTHLLGDSDHNWREIYGQTIYQNGKQVANAENLSAVTNAVLSSDNKTLTITKRDGTSFDFSGGGDLPTNLVTYTRNDNVSVAGNTKTTYTYGQTAIYAPNGLIMGGTAAQAGLVTRGICGVGTPTSTGECTKENLYINYDSTNTYSNTRQLVLQAGEVGTHYGNNLYQYCAARGDAVKNYSDATYSPKSHTQSITTITNSAGNTFTSAKVASAKTHTGWTNNATDDRIIPTMSFLAYWNGAHNTSNNSNLQYCANGTIVGTTGTQTISGAKTFSGNVTISGTLYIS